MFRLTLREIRLTHRELAVHHGQSATDTCLIETNVVPMLAVNLAGIRRQQCDLGNDGVQVVVDLLSPLAKILEALALVGYIGSYSVVRARLLSEISRLRNFRDFRRCGLRLRNLGQKDGAVGIVGALLLGHG